MQTLFPIKFYGNLFSKKLSKLSHLHNITTLTGYWDMTITGIGHVDIGIIF